MIVINGGNFQDAAGNILAGGLLSLKLTADAQSNLLDCQIAAGPQINCTLDNNGNVSNVNIESNANIYPAGTAYQAALYNSVGIPVWLRPQLWIFPNVNTDLGTMVPVSPIGPSYSGAVVLQPGGDQSIVSNNLLPNTGNQTQSLGLPSAPWNAYINTLNVANAANFLSASAFAGLVTVANINVGANLNVLGSTNVGSLNAGNLNVTGFTNLQNTHLGNLKLRGLVTTYNSIATVNNGLAARYGNIDRINSNLNLANTTIYSVPSGANGLYRFSGYAKVTTPGTTSGTIGPFILTWTDPDGVVLALAIPSTSQAGTISNSGNTTNTNGTFLLAEPAIIYCADSTNVNVAFTYASVGATNLRYSLHTSLEAL